MEYSGHIHQTGGGEQKPIFHNIDPHSQQRSHHSASFHTGASMDGKLMDATTASSSGRGGSRVPEPYDHFESNQSLVDQSHFMGRSPGSSPVPISAAAEYLRHQELNRGTPRKRVYQDWNQVAIFNTPSEAEEGIKNFENCRWKVGNKFTSREGFKVYWSCREGASCPVQIHLLYHSQLPRVVLFRNQPAHHHAEKVKTRGLLPEVESLIRELFDNGVNKPRRIQFILQKKGMEEVPQTKLSNFLVKLRREAALHGTPVSQRKERSSYLDELEDDEGGDGSYSQDDKSNSTLSPSAMFPSVILSTPSEQGGSHGSGMQSMSSGGYGHPSSHSIGHGGYGGGQHQIAGSGRYHSGAYQVGVSDYSPHHPRGGSSVYSGRSSGSVTGGGGKDEEADQSEVVTCSSSRRRSLYCRDETTEDGENVLADEKNIKDSILNRIRNSYSNRDMLHIREELKTLKHENKYTALSRLLAFTAGFLQDTFLEKRESDSPSGGHGGAEADI